MFSTALIIVNTIAKATFGEICKEVGQPIFTADK